MRKLLGLVFLICTTAFAETIDLGSHGVLSLTVPKGWRFDSQQIPDQGYAASISPPSGANAGVKLSIIYLPQAKPIDSEKLTADLLKVCDQFVGESVEQKKELRDFGLKGGYGRYCIFTDASLVGKPEQKGNFKFIGPGLVQLTNDVLIVITILGDDATGVLASEMLKSIASIAIAPERE